MPPIRETSFFIGEPNRQILGVLYSPSQLMKDFGWLICPPFAAERSFSQKFLVEFSRSLSREGYPVLRMDYRGTGDSAGLFEEFDIDDYLQDIELAVIELQQRTKLPCKGLFGLRLGATLAVLHANQFNNNPYMILWEPIVSGTQYLDEIYRSIKAQNLFKGQQNLNQPDIKDSLEKDGFISYFGFSVTKRQCESILELNLLEQDCPSECPILIVNITNGNNRKNVNPSENLCYSYSKVGNVDRCSVSFPLLWHPYKKFEVRSEVLFAPILEWVRMNCSRWKKSNAVRPTAVSTPKNRTSKSKINPISFVNQKIRESPVTFQSNGFRLSGILHSPANGKSNGMGIVMTAPGYVCRTMSNRLYVKIARALAAQSFHVLRYDPYGIGDSEGLHPYSNVEELFQHIQEGLYVPDATAAISFLEKEWDIKKIIMTSNCGGAVTDILAASKDPRVVGIIAVDFPLHYSQHYRPSAIGLFIKNVLGDSRIYTHLRLIRNQFRFRQHLFLHMLKQIVHTLVSHIPLFSHPQQIADIHWLHEHLGSDTNIHLYSALQLCMQRQIPLLSIFADPAYFTEFQQVQEYMGQKYPSTERLFEQHLVKGADHVFSTPAHTQYLINLMTHWLSNENQSWNQPMNASDTSSSVSSSLASHNT